MKSRCPRYSPQVGGAVVTNDWCIMHPKDAEGIVNSVDSDLGLHCLPRRICPKT